MKSRTQSLPSLSVIVPTLDEDANIKELIARISHPLDAANIDHEIVIIDDHSEDHTQDRIKSLSKRRRNLRLFTKRGNPGKAQSLLEGFKRAKNPVLCMIDADLQYPPEAIVPMYKLLIEESADVVVTERIKSKTSFMRRMSSKIFNTVFTRWMFGINFDSQSGLKLFKKSVLNNIELRPSPWSFDLEFIVRSLEKKYKIVNYRIPFSERKNGEAKVGILSTTLELAKASIKLRRHSSKKLIKANPSSVPSSNN